MEVLETEVSYTQEQEDIKPPPGSVCSQSADPGRLEGVVERCGGDVNGGGTQEEEGDAQPLREDRHAKDTHIEVELVSIAHLYFLTQLGNRNNI